MVRTTVFVLFYQEPDCDDQKCTDKTKRKIFECDALLPDFEMFVCMSERMAQHTRHIEDSEKRQEIICLTDQAL